ncbi:MAG: prepilin-type N-terminal cleavage/methylation domain-containing protein, partial [Bdellovibrionota bacterium]
MLRILKNSRGFSLIEGVIAAAALGILAVAGFQMFSDVGKQMANTGVSAGVNLARTTMLDAVNSSLAWSNTLAENPSLACIQNRTSCAALIGTQVGVKVIDGSGTIILADPADTAVGFDPEGRSCHTFPSPACP